MGAPYNCSLTHSLIFPQDIPSLASGDVLFLPRNFSKVLSFSPTSTGHLLQAIECWSFNWRLGNPLTSDVPAFYGPQSPETMITKPGLGYEMQGRKIQRDISGKQYTIYKLRQSKRYQKSAFILLWFMKQSSLIKSNTHHDLGIRAVTNLA